MQRMAHAEGSVTCIIEFSFLPKDTLAVWVLSGTSNLLCSTTVLPWPCWPGQRLSETKDRTNEQLLAEAPWLPCFWRGKLLSNPPLLSFRITFLASSFWPFRVPARFCHEFPTTTTSLDVSPWFLCAAACRATHSHGLTRIT